MDQLAAWGGKMVDRLADSLHHMLSLVAEYWTNTPRPVQTIIVAAFGTVIGALLTSRSQAKRRVIEELAAIHAAFALCFSIVNKALAVKRQHIRPMKAAYDEVLSTYDVWMERRSGPLELELDLRTLSKIRFSSAALERVVLEKCSLGHMGLAAALSLGDATDDLNLSTDFRNKLVADFQEKASQMNHQEKIAFYVGAYRDEKVDLRVSHNIEALAHQVDDCIFFGMLLADKLFALERRIRARNWWKYRLAAVPRQYPTDWTLARNGGLIPDSRTMPTG